MADTIAANASPTATMDAPNQAENYQNPHVDSVREQDILDQLLRPEVQDSLSELLNNLPKLTEMVTLLTRVYDMVRLVATDGVLLNDFTGGLLEAISPLQKKAKDIASAAIEANDRAQKDDSTISLFGLLKLLKDPQTQKLLRFVQAFMNVLSERERSKSL